MLIEIHLLARLLRIPLLRVEGVVALRDDETQHTSIFGRCPAEDDRPRGRELSGVLLPTARHSAATLPKPKPSFPPSNDRERSDQAMAGGMTTVEV